MGDAANATGDAAASSKASDPPETDLDYYSKPENYTGSSLQTMQRFVFVKEKENRLKSSDTVDDRKNNEAILLERYKRLFPMDEEEERQNELREQQQQQKEQQLESIEECEETEAPPSPSEQSLPISPVKLMVADSGSVSSEISIVSPSKGALPIEPSRKVSDSTISVSSVTSIKDESATKFDAPRSSGSGSLTPIEMRKSRSSVSSSTRASAIARAKQSNLTKEIRAQQKITFHGIYTEMSEFFSSLNDYNIVGPDLFVEDQRELSKRTKQTTGDFAVSATRVVSEKISEINPHLQNEKGTKAKNGHRSTAKQGILKAIKPKEYNKQDEGGVDNMRIFGGLSGQRNIPSRKHVRFDKLRRLVDLKTNRSVNYTPRDAQETKEPYNHHADSFLVGAKFYPEPPTQSYADNGYNRQIDTDAISFLFGDEGEGTENQEASLVHEGHTNWKAHHDNEQTATQEENKSTVENENVVSGEDVCEQLLGDAIIPQNGEATSFETTDKSLVTNENCISFVSDKDVSFTETNASVFSLERSVVKNIALANTIDQDGNVVGGPDNVIIGCHDEVSIPKDESEALVMKTISQTADNIRNAEHLRLINIDIDPNMNASGSDEDIKLNDTKLRLEVIHHQHGSSRGLIASHHPNLEIIEHQTNENRSVHSDQDDIGLPENTSKEHSEHSKHGKSSKVHTPKFSHLRVSDFPKHRRHEGDTDSLSQHSSNSDSVSGMFSHGHRRKGRIHHINPYDLVRDEMRKQAREKWKLIFKMVCLVKKLANAIIKKTDKKDGSLQTFTDFANETTYTGNLEGSGLSFDPNHFKANKEITISSEVKNILSTQSDLRSPEQIQTAMFGLQSLKSFAEYPLHMQEKLCKVAWYEVVPSRRVIIRQGHYAENFYFILSGQAVVTIMLQNPKTGESFVKTATVMRKGMSFGELALLHRSRRTATVTSQDTVQLLSIGREDFFDIFMSGHGGIPDHIKFVSNIDFMKDWPIEQLLEYPQYCLLHFFKRNVVIVKDSRVSDWLYVVKSGSCQVLKQLRGVTPKLGMRRDTEIDEIFKLPKVGATQENEYSKLGLVRALARSTPNLQDEVCLCRVSGESNCAATSTCPISNVIAQCKVQQREAGDMFTSTCNTYQHTASSCPYRGNED